MGYFAGWELIDGEWNLSDPGIGPEEDWMFSIADTFLFSIDIAPEDGEAVTYFFGTNPALVYDLDPAEVPANNLEEFVSFFSARYPGREEAIKEFVETYASLPTDTEDKYQSPQEAGPELGVAWCTALGITPPEELG
ncbi:hypothetical protein CMUST_10160 [Corynebacterium mustelae]|uniref:Uncharacterized protein n=1 Tax=Corynebacterium mustelae TaxID=571915 RepID=A0A0G3H3E4_9CORY|nr:hypothetical protein [Corynebacterium mustelae]AKK06348.1 hypothetical protein CMUST_10160 [Corynebacterium mustelae]